MENEMENEILFPGGLKSIIHTLKLFKWLFYVENDSSNNESDS
jgi:hypothetical protein